MEFVAFASFALLVVAWVVLPVRGQASPSATLDEPAPIREPVAA